LTFATINILIKNNFMPNISELITKVQDRAREYAEELTHIKDDVNEDVQDLEQDFSDMSDWIELKKREMVELINQRQEQGVDAEEIAAEIDGMLEDVEDTMTNFKDEFKQEFED
jgi:methyl-accepting chemotaxis protein